MLSNEGGAGLYEAIWELNTKFPDSALSEKYRAASSALRSLFEAGLIEFYKEHWTRETEDRFEELTLSADEILEQVVHWYPEYDGVQVGFNATPQGERAALDYGVA